MATDPTSGDTLLAVPSPLGRGQDGGCRSGWQRERRRGRICVMGAGIGPHQRDLEDRGDLGLREVVVRPDSAP